MLVTAVLLATHLNLAPSPTPVIPRRDVPVYWKGRGFEADELPGKLPEAARRVVEEWAPFAAAAEYRLDVLRDGRVVLIGPADNSRVDDQLALIGRVQKMVDEELPAPPREAEAHESAGGADALDFLPEDPEQGPLPEDPEEEGPVSVAEPSAKVQAYGSEAIELDTASAVVLVVRNETEFGDLLDDLARRHDYLNAWVHTTRSKPGFVLGHPLAGAYVELAAGQEEFDPENELVNRTARLLLLRRFGELPNWVVQGWAWHVEIALRKSVYCFPYRSEFVYVTEHTGWDRDLRNRYRLRPDEPLDVTEFAGWKRGSYSDSHARAAWGMTEFLARHHGEVLPLFLEELRKVRDRESRIEKGGGTWVRDRDYEVPPETQERLLKELVGPDVLAEAVKFFVDGDAYRPGKKKKRGR